MENKPDNILTREELSVYLKIPKSTLYKLVRWMGESLLKR